MNRRVIGLLADPADTASGVLTAAPDSGQSKLRFRDR